MANWFDITDIGLLDSPALTVFPDRVKQNIRTAIEMTGDVERLRPHVKTHKSPEALQLMLDAGITKFKCATIAEAEMLGKAGAPDVVLAYQVMGPKLQRLIRLIQVYPKTTYACLTDNERSAREQSAAFAAAGLKTPVYLDLNVGMNRSGVVPGQAALSVYQLLHQLEGVWPAGLHAYDGHLRQPDFSERKAQCDACFTAVEGLRDKIMQSGFKVPNIIIGGSPSFSIHAKRPGVECSPGTFIYWDKGYSDLCPEQAFLPATVLVTRVISRPTPTRICTDLGHKSVGAENDLQRRLFFLNATDVIPVGQSEEHLVLEVPEGHAYQPGDVLYALPFHVCPTVALYEKMATIVHGKITGEWHNVARNRSIEI